MLTIYIGIRNIADNIFLGFLAKEVITNKTLCEVSSKYVLPM